MKIILVLGLILALGQVKAQGLELRLVAASDTIYQGDSLTLTLSLNNQDISDFLHLAQQQLSISDVNASRFTFLPAVAPGFSKTFKLVPAETGKHRFGPFELVLGSQVLRSNAVSVEVLAKPTSSVILRLEKTRLKLGEEVMLTLEGTDGRGLDLDLLSAVVGDGFSVRKGSGASNSIMIDGKPKTTTSISLYLKPNARGKLVIRPKSFIKLPDDVQIPDLQVIVE